jgi:hypothetical protein
MDRKAALAEQAKTIAWTKAWAKAKPPRQAERDRHTAAVKRDMARRAAKGK